MITGYALAGLALLAWPGRRRCATARLRAVLAGRPGSRPRERTAPTPARLGAIAAGVGVLAVIGLPTGLLLAVPVAILTERLLRRVETGAERRRRLAREAALPIALDLLAGALRAGLPVAGATALVADCIGGPLADELRQVGSLGSLGADARAAWHRYAADPLWAGVARAVARAADSGGALAEAFERVADDRRAELSARAESTVQRAAVLAMAPLGLCFLPAFVCVGVVPVVIGLLTGALR